MSFDTIASLQRMQQMQQAQAAAGKRLVLRRLNSGLDIGLTVAAILLFLPTFTLSLWLLLIYLAIKESVIKTCLVKNVATGEKFKVMKSEFKQYKRMVKNKEKEVRNIIPTAAAIADAPAKPAEEKDEIEDSALVPAPEPIVQEPEVSEDPAPKPQPKKKSITFNVAGVTFENDKGKEIQPLLRRIAREIAKEQDVESFGGWTNKDILEYMAEVSQFEDVMFGDYVSFEKDLDNEFDQNAIKVMANLNDKQFHIGYVPKDNNVQVGKLLDDGLIDKIAASFVGGKTKEIDYDFEKDKDIVVVKELTLGVEITLILKEEE
ncbi:HIRAN domain-containing protein [Heyndrickxia acidiproducens]|uniref:HIRAN domain-containing protein n=1 Tax=Heyndrickxia acidiproducens TaxID=1121084 RepID=UPI000378057B|nr:HIRAN domain-containing protein [Heyndrickxia acidiproducens]